MQPERKDALDPPTSAFQRAGTGASRKLLLGRCASHASWAVQQARPARPAAATAGEHKHGQRRRREQAREAAVGHEGRHSAGRRRKNRPKVKEFAWRAGIVWAPNNSFERAFCMKEFFSSSKRNRKARVFVPRRRFSRIVWRFSSCFALSNNSDPNNSFHDARP